MLVSLGEVSVDATLPRLLTSDPAPFSVQVAVTLRFTPGRESVFLSNFMSGRASIGVDDLKDLVLARAQ